MSNRRPGQVIDGIYIYPVIVEYDPDLILLLEDDESGVIIGQDFFFLLYSITKNDHLEQPEDRDVGLLVQREVTVISVTGDQQETTIVVTLNQPR